MKNIFCIRYRTAFISWDYFEVKTEALLFGDIEGYQYLINCLERAKASSAFIHLDEIDFESNSMRILIAPALTEEIKRPRLRIIERPVYINACINMELVICGNVDGYDYLLKKVLKILEKSSYDLDNHVHLEDENDDCLLARSASLNIRHPLAIWNKDNLGHWVNVIYQKQKDCIPQELELLFGDPEPYEEPRVELIKQFLKVNSTR